MRREDVKLVDWLGYQIRSLRIPFDLEPGSRAYYYQPYDDEPWDLIAYKFYGDEELWYIIADVNGVSNPLIFPKATERLVIPRLF